MKVSEIVEQKISPLFDDLDIKLVEVEYVKRHDGMHLVVYIDKDSGVTVEDCSMVSHMIDPILDELNPTNDAPYAFDVSSYGLDKPLKYDWQFEKYLNKVLEIKLYKKVDELKDFEGVLIGFNKETLTFKLTNNKKTKSKNKVEEGKVVELDRKLIATVLPYIEF